MINWDTLISEKRLGLEDRQPKDGNDIRTTFQRDYDRIIFSSPFRRLQNKTQVFPLPGSIFVHNRLTHTLEVASVGRSLGNIVSASLRKTLQDKNLRKKIGEIGSIVSTACLAHDMGNPPFGHSGESAIADFFKRGKGAHFKDQLSESQWNDFICFEGNANAFRVLTHQFIGKREGGFTLTYSTLASIVKYPFESLAAGNKPKFGFFQSEKEIYRKIASHLRLEQITEEPLRYKRHPLVYLVEAADDICYQIMDVEDAFKLNILTLNETKDLLLNFFDPNDDVKLLKSVHDNFEMVINENEQVAYLRALVIGKLTKECAEIFIACISKEPDLSHIKSLVSNLPEPSAKAMKEVKHISLNQIYNHRTVIEIEIAGYKILNTLLETFITAVVEPDEFLSKKLLALFPEQYKSADDSLYGKILSVVDFVSGMTDLYALDLYRKITGMELPGIG